MKSQNLVRPLNIKHEDITLWCGDYRKPPRVRLNRSCFNIAYNYVMMFTVYNKKNVSPLPTNSTIIDIKQPFLSFIVCVFG
jgi:hypothetical protein